MKANVNDKIPSFVILLLSQYPCLSKTFPNIQSKVWWVVFLRFLHIIMWKFNMAPLRKSNIDYESMKLSSKLFFLFPMNVVHGLILVVKRNLEMYKNLTFLGHFQNYLICIWLAWKRTTFLWFNQHCITYCLWDCSVWHS